MLPPGVLVFERGWLSSNCVLLQGGPLTALVDSGYSTHARQTVDLVMSRIGDKPLDMLLNTHLHSDHCGGNHALQSKFPQLSTLIPPGSADAVKRWDAYALSYVPTGQKCDRFSFDGLLQPGTELMLGAGTWQVHAAPGHDPHSVILFEAQSRTLISADALWENGFGVIFPELEGVSAFAEVSATLDLIERLSPAVVIPGHGSVFTAVNQALSLARRRIDGFVQNPTKHALHAAKVLLKFKLLELQRVSRIDFMAWAEGTNYFRLVWQRFFSDLGLDAWIENTLKELARSGAIKFEDAYLLNA